LTVLGVISFLMTMNMSIWKVWKCHHNDSSCVCSYVCMIYSNLPANLSNHSYLPVILCMADFYYFLLLVIFSVKKLKKRWYQRFEGSKHFLQLSKSVITFDFDKTSKFIPVVWLKFKQNVSHPKKRYFCLSFLSLNLTYTFDNLWE
jgi:hypothetical protein